MDLQQGSLITIFNMPYLVQSYHQRRIKKALLPNDSFDLSFIIDMIGPGGKNVDLNEYRLVTVSLRI